MPSPLSGTNDQTALLVIWPGACQGLFGGSRRSYREKALSGVYENYRLEFRRIRCPSPDFPRLSSGHPEAAADGHDWSVELVTFLRGGDAYTLLGMTWADSDLIQVQENIISKTVNSLTFTQ